MEFFWNKNLPINGSPRDASDNSATAAAFAGAAAAAAPDATGSLNGDLGGAVVSVPINGGVVLPPPTCSNHIGGMISQSGSGELAAADAAAARSSGHKRPRASSRVGVSIDGAGGGGSSASLASGISAAGADQDEALRAARASTTEEEKLAKMTAAAQTIIECLGENPQREGLLRTPERMARALLYCTQGYEKSLSEVVNGAVFEEHHHELILVKDIDLYSLCEHHLVPFVGKVHIAYIPRSKVLGLSKLARIADMYARRLQVQERLTKQIAEAIRDAINPLGVAVVIQASHMCMVMRGVQKAGSTTITSSVLGCFQADSRTRSEFFSLVGLHR